MFRKVVLVAFFATVLCAAGALAQNVHFVKGPNFTDTGTTLTASGKLAGLGQGDVTIILEATGTAEVECTNPGGNVAPGQDTSVTTTGSETLAVPKNGHVNFTVSTAEPVVGDDACPNPKWTPEVIDVVFTSATITVIQGGEIVLQESFTF